MGLCLSHCGQAQHKAAVVAVSISHQSSASPARPSRGDAQADASKSLKRFLHLYGDGSDGRKRSSASPRASLDAIPHSSELFSLPSEGETDSDRSRSPSPARGSVASIARSSTSSRAPVSPNGRKSVGVRGGRFSTDKPPMPPRASNAKKAPTRKSCSSLRQAATEPHRNLVETIARLEKFCDVKLFLEKRGSVLRNSSHAMGAACVHENSILLHDSCRDLAQKLLCFANEHAYQNSNGDGVQSMTEKEMNSDAPELKESVPLEKSVASFLKEVENFVSKVDAQQETEEVTEEKRDECLSRLPSSRFQDADEKIQFTDFEATFESPCSEFTETSPSDRSPEADQASDRPCDAIQDHAQDHQARPSVSAECEAEVSTPVASLRRAPHRHSRAVSDLGGMHHIDGITKGSQKEKKRVNSMARLALTEISTNVAPGRKGNLLKALKRGVTRSMDLQDTSIPKLEFVAFKRQRWDMTKETHNSMLDSPVIRDSGCPDATATLSREKSLGIEAANSATIERVAHEGEGDAVSPSADAASSECQTTTGRISVDGKEPIQELVCAEEANGGNETSDVQGTGTALLNNDSEKSLCTAFDNLLKLLQSPTAELAQNTSELLALLAAQPGGTNTQLESPADGTYLSEVEIASKTQADILPPCEAESWHDAPASLSTTEQPELHSSTQ